MTTENLFFNKMLSRPSNQENVNLTESVNLNESVDDINLNENVSEIDLNGTDNESDNGTDNESANSDDGNMESEAESVMYESVYFKYWFEGCKTIDDVLCNIEGLRQQFEAWKEEGHELTQPVDTGYCFIDKVYIPN